MTKVSIISKQKLIIHNRIASVCYMDIDKLMKWLINHTISECSKLRQDTTSRRLLTNAVCTKSQSG